MKKLLLSSLLILLAFNVYSQSEVEINSNGIIVPRVDRSTITGEKGQIIFDSNSNSYWLHDGTAWQELTPGSTDELELVEDTLRTVGGTNKVLKEDINYWSRNGVKLNIDTGFVGIGAINPRQLLHLRTDTFNSLVRYDNKLSAATSLIDTFTYGSVSSLESLDYLNGKEWLDLDVTKVNSHDSILLEGALIPAFDVRTEALKINFDFTANPLPTDAIITGISFELIAKAVGTEPTGAKGDLYPLGIFSNDTYVQPLRILGFFTDREQEVSVPVRTINFTTAELNSGNLNLRIYFFERSRPDQDTRLNIDLIRVKVDYQVSPPSDLQTTWTAGINKNGHYKISNHSNVDKDEKLVIKSNGVVAMREILISENAAPNRVLVSDQDGNGTWTDLNSISADSFSLWQSNLDTLGYFDGPVELENDLDAAAIILDNRRTQLNHSYNLFQTERQWINFLLDTDNNQSNSHFALYNNQVDDSGFPTVKFAIDGQDCWINNQGDFGIGTNSPDSRLHLAHPSGQGNAFIIENTSTTNQWEFYNAGEILAVYYNGSFRGAFDHISGSYTSISDVSYKSNIEDIGKKEVEKLMQLKPKRYHMKGFEDEEKQYGLIAQEVKSVFPSLAPQVQSKNAGDADDLNAVNYTALIPVLIKAVQDQEKRIEELENLLRSK